MNKSIKVKVTATDDGVPPASTEAFSNIVIPGNNPPEITVEFFEKSKNISIEIEKIKLS